MSHIDRATWLAFLAESLPAAEQARVSAHLLEPCEACEELLATMHAREELDRLDGVVDEALLGASTAAPTDLPDDLGFAKVVAELRAPKRRSSRLAWLPLAAAAGLAAVLILRPGPEHLKGDGSAPARLRLELLRADPSRGESVTPLGSKGQAQLGDVLVFRVRLAEPGCLRLYTGEANNARPIDDAPTCLPRGEHVISSQGVVLGWPVKERGLLRLRAEAELESGERISDEVEVQVP